FGPRVVADLAGLWNRVEDPADLSGGHVERADVPWRSRQRFRHAAAHNQEILEHDAWRAGADGQFLRRLIEPFPEIDAAVRAERPDRRSRCPGQRTQRTALSDEHTTRVHRDAG